jgi:hypothetical protein
MPVCTRDWDGRLELADGRFLGVEPCWILPGQTLPCPAGNTAAFRLVSSTEHVHERRQNALVFEFESDPGDLLTLNLNGLTETGTVTAFARGSRELWYRDECVRMLEEASGLAPGSPERDDLYHHVAFKAKLHRAIPAAGYTANWEWVDDTPLAQPAHYRVRVEQRNAQRAWSSPVWVVPGRMRAMAPVKAG